MKSEIALAPEWIDALLDALDNPSKEEMRDLYEHNRELWFAIRELKRHVETP